MMITTILRDPRDRPFLAGNWYFRWADLSKRLKVEVEEDPNEVYASSDSDYNSIGSVLSKITVKNVSDIKDIDEYKQGESNYYFKHYYDSIKKKLTDKEPPVVEKSFIVDVDSAGESEEKEEKGEKKAEKKIQAAELSVNVKE